MAKSRLLKALDAHQGHDYKLEKQEKQRKQATRNKKSRPALSNVEEKDNVQAHVNGTHSLPQAESEGWESDESEAAKTTSVRRPSTSRMLPIANIAYRSIHLGFSRAQATVTAVWAPTQLENPILKSWKMKMKRYRSRTLIPSPLKKKPTFSPTNASQSIIHLLFRKPTDPSPSHTLL